MSKYFRGGVRSHINHMLGRGVKTDVNTTPSLANSDNKEPVPNKSAGETHESSTQHHEHSETKDHAKIEEQTEDAKKTREKCGKTSRWDILPSQSQCGKREEATEMQSMGNVLSDSQSLQPQMGFVPSCNPSSTAREETAELLSQKSVSQSGNEPCRRDETPDVETGMSVSSLVERLRQVQEGPQCTINEIRKRLNTLTNALPTPSKDALAALAPLPTTPPRDASSFSHLNVDIPRPAGKTKGRCKNRKRKPLKTQKASAVSSNIKQAFKSPRKRPRGRKPTGVDVQKCNPTSSKSDVQVASKTSPTGEKQVNTAEIIPSHESKNIPNVKPTMERRIVMIKSKPQLSQQSSPSVSNTTLSPLTSPSKEPTCRRIVKLKSSLNSFKAILHKDLQQVADSNIERLGLCEVAEKTVKVNSDDSPSHAFDEAVVHPVKDLDLSQFFPSSHSEKGFQEVIDTDTKTLTAETIPVLYDSSSTDTCGQFAEHPVRDLDFSQFFPSAHLDVGSLIDCFEQQCVIVGPDDENVAESDQAQTEWCYFEDHNLNYRATDTDESLLEQPANYDDSDCQHTNIFLSPFDGPLWIEGQSIDERVQVAGKLPFNDENHVTTAGSFLTKEIGITMENGPSEVTTAHPTQPSNLTDRKNNPVSMRMMVTPKKARKGSITNLNERERLKALFSVRRKKISKTESTGRHETQQSQTSNISVDSATVASLAETVGDSVATSPQVKDSDSTSLLTTQTEQNSPSEKSCLPLPLSVKQTDTVEAGTTLKYASVSSKEQTQFVGDIMEKFCPPVVLNKGKTSVSKIKAEVAGSKAEYNQSECSATSLTTVLCDLSVKHINKTPTHDDTIKQSPKSEDSFCLGQASNSNNSVDFVSTQNQEQTSVFHNSTANNNDCLPGKLSLAKMFDETVVNDCKQSSPVVKDCEQSSSVFATNESSTFQSRNLNIAPCNSGSMGHLLPSHFRVGHECAEVTEVEISVDVTADKVNNNEMRPNENVSPCTHGKSPSHSFAPASPAHVQMSDAVSTDNGSEFVTTYINLSVPEKQTLEICFPPVDVSDSILQDHDIEVEVSTETEGFVQSVGTLFMQKATGTCGNMISAKTTTTLAKEKQENVVSCEACVCKEMDVTKAPALPKQFKDSFLYTKMSRKFPNAILLSDSVSETSTTVDCDDKMQKNFDFSRDKIPAALKTMDETTHKMEETKQKELELGEGRLPAETMDVDNITHSKAQEKLQKTETGQDRVSQVENLEKVFANEVKGDTADQESVPSRQEYKSCSLPANDESCTEMQLFVPSSPAACSVECSSPSPPPLIQWNMQSEDSPGDLYESPPKLERMILSRSLAGSQSGSSQPVSPQLPLLDAVPSHLKCTRHVRGKKVCMTSSDDDDAACCNSTSSASSSLHIGAVVSNPFNPNSLVMDHSLLSSPPALCTSDLMHVSGDSDPAAPYIGEADDNCGDVDVGIESDMPKHSVDLLRITSSHVDLLSATGTMSSPNDPGVDAQSTALESSLNVDVDENMATASDDSDDTLSDDAEFVTSGRHGVFSPSTSRTDAPDEEGKMLPSLDSLLNDMKKATAEQQEMKTMHAELKSDFLYGRGIGMSGEDNDTEDTDCEEFTAEQRQTLMKLSLEEGEIQDVHPGEAVLGEQPCGQLFNEDLTPYECGVVTTSQSSLGQLFLHFQPDLLMDVLASDIIALTYDQLPCKAEVQRWLLFILSCHRNPTVVEKCENQLLQVLQWQVEGDQKHTWTPHILDIIRIFVNWGADKKNLIFDTSAVDFAQLSAIQPMQENDMLREVPMKSQRNVEAFLKALSCLLQTRPCYSTEELNQLLLMVCQVSLDHSLSREYLLYDLQVCVASILQCYEASQWHTAVPWLCRKLSTLSSHHHNQVFVTQLFSPTFRRCGFLQQRLSYSLLHAALIGQSVSDQQIDNFQIQDLCEVVPSLKGLVHTDNYLLSSLIQLLDLSVGPSAQHVTQRKQLCRLQEAVRLIVSEIRDSMQQLDCTKVKGMLLHLSLKWDLSIKANSTRQRKIFSCFQSTLVVEQLEDQGPACSDDEVVDDVTLTHSDDQLSDEEEVNAGSSGKRLKTEEESVEEVEENKNSTECREESGVVT